jgi:putative exporter of polyketide antibiotics
MRFRGKDGIKWVVLLAKLIAFGLIAALVAAFVLVAIFNGLGIDTNLTESSGNDLTGNDLAFVLIFGVVLVAVGFAAGRRR